MQKRSPRNWRSTVERDQDQRPADYATDSYQRGFREGTLLDIGGGLGILSLELLDAGFSRAIVVDASSAYLAACFGRGSAKRPLRHQPNSCTAISWWWQASWRLRTSSRSIESCVATRLYEPLLEHALHLAKTGFAMLVSQGPLVREGRGSGSRMRCAVEAVIHFARLSIRRRK